jgi:hypothetical protein
MNAWEIKILKGIKLRRDSEEKSSEGEALKASRIIDQELSKREWDRSRPLDLNKVCEL